MRCSSGSKSSVHQQANAWSPTEKRSTPVELLVPCTCKRECVPNLAGLSRNKWICRLCDVFYMSMYCVGSQVQPCSQYAGKKPFFKVGIGLAKGNLYIDNPQMARTGANQQQMWWPCPAYSEVALLSPAKAAKYPEEH